MKGGIAAMLDAIKQIDFSKLKYGMKMYLTYDEEIDFGGLKHTQVILQKEKMQI